MFLVSTFFIAPLNEKATSQKDFFSDSRNLARDEHISLVRNLRATELNRADTVLNLKKKTIEKCRDYSRFASNNYSDVYGYFHAIYPEQLDAVQLTTEE